MKYVYGLFVGAIFLIGFSSFSAGDLIKRIQNYNFNFSGTIRFYQPVDYRNHDTNYNYSNCSPSGNDLPFVSAAEVMVRNRAQENGIVNYNEGIFTVNFIESASKVLNIIPERAITTGYLNGISTYDLFLIEAHVQNHRLIDCPMSRIAADIDHLGDITEEDAIKLRRAILNITIPPIEKSWQFAPNFLAPQNFNYRHITAFTDRFWSNEAGAPFDAELDLLGIKYKYSGQTKWMEGIENWTYAPDEPEKCREFQYGFWLIKTGDINGTAIVEPSLTEPIPDVLPTLTYGSLDGVNMAAQNLLTLSIKIRAKKELSAYQLGMKLDPKVFKVRNLNPGSTNFSQEEEGFNLDPEELKDGHIRTLWIRDFKTTKSGIAINDWTEIINIEVESLLPLATEITNLEHMISLKPELLSPEFIGETGLINNEEVELLIALTSKK